MTNLEKLTIKAIAEWCKSRNLKPVGKMRHIFPRAYVLGRSASRCILIATPPADAEPQVNRVNEIMHADGSTAVNLFDDSLRAGDWCSVAYVCFSGGQQRVAVKAVSA